MNEQCAEFSLDPAWPSGHIQLPATLVTPPQLFVQSLSNFPAVGEHQFFDCMATAADQTLGNGESRRGDSN